MHGMWAMDIDDPKFFSSKIAGAFFEMLSL